MARDVTFVAVVYDDIAEFVKVSETIYRDRTLRFIESRLAEFSRAIAFARRERLLLPCRESDSIGTVLRRGIKVSAEKRDVEGTKERKAYHCCGRAATAGFATSLPVTSTGTDRRTLLTQT